jgi:hypothetical protein
MNGTTVEVAHALPGRVRFKISKLKHDPELSRELGQRLAGVEGIERVEISPLTGSVLVIFDQTKLHSLESLGALSSALFAVLPDADLGSIDFNAFLHPSHGAAAGNGAAAAGEGSASWPSWPDKASREQVLQALPWVLTGLGVRELLLGNRSVMPTWYDYFWFAFSTYYIVNRHPFDHPGSD